MKATPSQRPLDARARLDDLYRTFDQVSSATSRRSTSPKSGSVWSCCDPVYRSNEWLAAQVIQRDFRLLTSNAKDFADVPGLQMVVLKQP